MMDRLLRAVDDIAARFTRLLGLGAAMGIIAASNGDLWTSIFQAAGLESVGLGEGIHILAMVGLAIFATLQAFSVSFLLGEKIGEANGSFRGVTKAIIGLISIPMMIVAIYIITTVNQFATSVLTGAVQIK